MISEEKLAMLKQTPTPESLLQKASTINAFSRIPYPCPPYSSG
jgi:hypothetical protein